MPRVPLLLFGPCAVLLSLLSLVCPNRHSWSPFCMLFPLLPLPLLCRLLVLHGCWQLLLLHCLGLLLLLQPQPLLLPSRQLLAANLHQQICTAWPRCKYRQCIK